MEKWNCEITEKPAILYRVSFGGKTKFFRRTSDIFQWCVKQVMLKVFDEFEQTTQVDNSYYGADGTYYERINDNQSIHIYWIEVKKKAMEWAREGGYDYAETKIREYLANDLELPGRLNMPDENVLF